MQCNPYNCQYWQKIRIQICFFTASPYSSNTLNNPFLHPFFSGLNFLQTFFHQAWMWVNLSLDPAVWNNITQVNFTARNTEQDKFWTSWVTLPLLSRAGIMPN